MPCEPKKTNEEEHQPSTPTNAELPEPNVRSYYYDDAHGYEDYEPGGECIEGEEEGAEQGPEE